MQTLVCATCGAKTARTSNNQRFCVPCGAEARKARRAECSAAYRRNNRGRLREYMREYRARPDHSGKSKMRSRLCADCGASICAPVGRQKYCESCRVAVRKRRVAARSVVYRQNNSGLLREYMRVYLARLRTENPEIVREWSRRRRARIRNSQILRFTSQDLRARLSVFGHRCWICGAENAGTVDHVKALARGGAHTLSNLRPACSNCNTRKRAKPVPAKHVAGLVGPSRPLPP